MECPGNMEYSETAVPCVPSCENPNVALTCPAGKIFGIKKLCVILPFLVTPRIPAKEERGSERLPDVAQNFPDEHLTVLFQRCYFLAMCLSCHAYLVQLFLIKIYPILVWTDPCLEKKTNVRGLSLTFSVVLEWPTAVPENFNGTHFSTLPLMLMFYVCTFSMQRTRRDAFAPKERCWWERTALAQVNVDASSPWLDREYLWVTS